MPEIAYVDGQYVPRTSAQISLEDRGYQFADGVYEVCLIVDGACWDFQGHYERLLRSTAELGIACEVTPDQLQTIFRELMLRNRLRTALVYLQMTRGVARRNHVFGKALLAPVLTITASRFKMDESDAVAQAGVHVISTDDIRWRRVDIKSISLLPNILAKQEAAQKGAAEAWLVRDGLVTEGSSSNAWIINKDNVLVTHRADHDILNGITRLGVIDCAETLGLPVDESGFTLEEVKSAKEAFLTSATNFVMPVTQIDDAIIGNGKPGEFTLQMRRTYIDHAIAAANPILKTSCN